MEVMTNDKWMPLPVVKVEPHPPQLRFSRQQGMDLGGTIQYHLSLFALSGRRRVTRHHQVLCTQRGILQPQLGHPDPVRRAGHPQPLQDLPAPGGAGLPPTVGARAAAPGFARYQGGFDGAPVHPARPLPHQRHPALPARGLTCATSLGRDRPGGELQVKPTTIPPIPRC